MEQDEEIKKAQTATEEVDTLFDKIVRKEIPANIIYEDELVSVRKPIRFHTI